MSRIATKSLILGAVLAALMLGLGAAQALAAPSLQAEITPSPTELRRSDEYMSFTVKVSAAPIVPGETKAICAPGTWTGAPTFSYQWVREGVSLGSGDGAQTSEYTIQAADLGHVLTCEVIGTNANAVALSNSAPLVVPPAPSTAPPSISSAVLSRPTITGTASSGSILECKAPTTGWNGSPSWTFSWITNGQPGHGTVTETTATTSKYQVAAADVPSVIQCVAVVTNAGGSAVAISGNKTTSPAPTTPPASPSALLGPTVTDSARLTTEPVTLTFEGPPGLEEPVISVYQGLSGGTGGPWTCNTVHQATALEGALINCTRSEALMAGESYRRIKFVVHLGQDAPEPSGGATVTVSGGGAATPVTATGEYTFTPGLGFGIVENSFVAGGFKDPAATEPYNKAGGHPYQAYTTFGFNSKKSVILGTGIERPYPRPIESIKDVVVDAPRGFVGNALSTPKLCKAVEEVILGLCPAESAVGGVDVYAFAGSPPNEEGNNLYPTYFPQPQFAHRGLYSIEPEFGEPAQFAFGFSLAGVSYTFVPELRAQEGYAISFRTAPIITEPQLFGTNVHLCDFGANIEINPISTIGPQFTGCRNATDANAYPHPLVTNPTRCAGTPPTAGLKVDSWQHPAEVKTAEYTAHAIEECEAVEFKPESELQPTNHDADSPTGLNVEIKMPIEGVLSPTGVSQANLDTATVTLPKGMSINPAAAEGLQACTEAQIKLHSNEPDECPESSKIGTIEIDTPIIRKTLTGNIYIAQQNHNPFNSTLGLYMSFASARDGVRIKIAGKLVTDPVTGQLTSVFTENPEAPFSRLALKFNSGPRAPLVNPPRCGTYAIHSEFSPWSAANPANPTPEEISSQDSTYQVTSGPNGSACPNGGLQTQMNAGLRSTQAGAKSPFDLTLTREDGSDRLTGLNVTTPKGLTAYLKGIPYCSDATLAGISEAEETGRPQLEHPSCPAASQVGTVEAGAGAGPFPFQTPGKVYLAGPYKGAPISLAVVTPAVAGPFDLGNVLIRNAVYVDRETAQVTTKSDPIPTILHGILLDIRQIRLHLERPGGFTAAPTNCEPTSVDASVSGEGGSSAQLSNRFQVGGCEALGFKPKLSLKLLGGTHRGANPRLVAKLTMPEGGANIASASVALPHTEFLDQGHIRTVCTRVQFAANQCPAGSVYGQAEATTPLLDETLRGPVYLRSSSHLLPDLIAVLKGPETQPIEVDLDGRIDSIHGGIRTTFETVPDQPVSSFTLRMQGGKKGLLENAPRGQAKSICSSPQKATAIFGAQNGRSVTLYPKLQSTCGKKQQKKSKSKKSGGHKKAGRGS
jgi:hypothetical protein